ncbi:glycosyl hydrolase family 8 [Rufibacter immobilis]|uniref:glycosyl hydrolase family 8 n=1 Tax=Rufibacter immobilis TaxID=1348778 RepID=UPI0035E85E32
MKKSLVFRICCLLLSWSLVSCSSGEEEEAATDPDTPVDITLKSASNAPVANATAYLFRAPSTEANGRNPTLALAKGTSNASGMVSFNLKNVPNLPASGTLHVTVLTGTDNTVLGSAPINYTKGQPVKQDLVVTVPTSTTSYAHGFMPTTLTPELAMSEYNRWKTTQVVACNDGLRLISENPQETKVEAVGFGMLLAAYAQDKATFDGIHRFYNSKRTPEAGNMMAWSVTCNGYLDKGSATDGDIDVAFALIVASKHWGESYLTAAKEILKVVKEKVVVPCNSNGKSIYVLGPGYNNVAWGGCNMLDLMYHTPAFFRVFATVTGDNIWNQLADDTYTLLEASAHPTTGLVPDWQTAAGAPGPGGRAGYFGYDACRAPWRLTLDYLWNGNAKAEAWAKKVSNWASQIGPANIKDGYELNGTPRGTYGGNSAFIGGFAVAAMSNSQTTVNQFGTEMAKLKDTYWFNINTRVLYLFTLTGKFYNPLAQ